MSKPTGKIVMKFFNKLWKRKMENNKDAPLSVRIENGQFILSLGVNNLLFGANSLLKERATRNKLAQYPEILDAETFAADFLAEVIKADEVGNNRVTNLLDNTILAAADSGVTAEVKYNSTNE